MFVIVSYGQCVINRLNQVKVFESKKDAETMLAQLALAKPREADGFNVEEVHFIKAEAGE